MKLINLLDSPDTSVEEIVKLLRLDPSLTSEMLRVSNSALYGSSGRIDHVSQALTMLGTETVKRIVLTLSMGAFTRSFLRDEKQEVCWHHSVACAILSERLAPPLGQPAEKAYTVGLLHDVGRLALIAQFPAEYSELLTVARYGTFDQMRCEQELFDIDHCAAGAWLAEQWNLPEDLVQAIGQHHSCESPDGSMPHVISAGCQLADVLGFGVLQRPGETSLESYVANLPVQDPSALAAELEASVAQIRTAIHIASPHK